MRHSLDAIAKLRNAPGDDKEIFFLLIYQCVMIQNKINVLLDLTTVLFYSCNDDP